MNFHDNSKNINRKIDFSFVSAHCASSIKNGSKLRGVVCISSVGKKPRSSREALNWALIMPRDASPSDPGPEDVNIRWVAFRMDNCLFNLDIKRIRLATIIFRGGYK